MNKNVHSSPIHNSQTSTIKGEINSLWYSHTMEYYTVVLTSYRTNMRELLFEAEEKKKKSQKSTHTVQSLFYKVQKQIPKQYIT